MSSDLRLESSLPSAYAASAGGGDEEAFIDPRIEKISRRSMSLLLEDDSLSSSLFEDSEDGSLAEAPFAMRRAQSMPLGSPKFLAPSPSRSPGFSSFESPRSLSAASTVTESPRTFDGSPASIKSPSSWKKKSSSSVGSSPRKPPLPSPGKHIPVGGGGAGEVFSDIAPADLMEKGMSQTKRGLYVVRSKTESKERGGVPALVIDAHQSKHTSGWGQAGGRSSIQMTREITEEIANLIELECDLFKSSRAQTETGSRIKLDARGLERDHRSKLTPNAKRILRDKDEVSIVATYVKEVDCWSIHFHLQ